MCEHCLLAELHEEWIEPVVQVMRLEGLLFGHNQEETEALVMMVRISRSIAYVPRRVRATVDERMVTRRNN